MFYTQLLRLQIPKAYKLLMTQQYFYAFGIYLRKSCTQNVDEIEPRGRFHQRSTYSFYARRSRMRKKRQSSQHCHFALLGSGSVKVERNMFMKLTPGDDNFTNILHAVFSYDNIYLQFGFEIFQQNNIVNIVKLTPDDNYTNYFQR